MSDRATVETQSPDQGQPWVEVDSFFELDDALGDGVAALSGRVPPATAVRVRVGDETRWVGVADGARVVVAAPPTPRLSRAGTWDVLWDSDEPRWLFRAAAYAPKHLLARAAVDCARMAAEAVKAAGARRKFDQAARMVEQWARDDREFPGAPVGPLYDAYLVAFDAERAYRLPLQAKAAFDALKETINLRDLPPIEALSRVPDCVARAVGGGKKTRIASLDAQMASMLRRWVSLGMAMESRLGSVVP